jgi:hypothetical protein
VRACVRAARTCLFPCVDVHTKAPEPLCRDAPEPLCEPLCGEMNVRGHRPASATDRPAAPFSLQRRTDSSGSWCVTDPSHGRSLVGHGASLTQPAGDRHAAAAAAAAAAGPSPDTAQAGRSRARRSRRRSGSAPSARRSCRARCSPARTHRRRRCRRGGGRRCRRGRRRRSRRRRRRRA